MSEAAGRLKVREEEKQSRAYFSDGGKAMFVIQRGGSMASYSSAKSVKLQALIMMKHTVGYLSIQWLFSGSLTSSIGLGKLKSSR